MTSDTLMETVKQGLCFTAAVQQLASHSLIVFSLREAEDIKTCLGHISPQKINLPSSSHYCNMSEILFSHEYHPNCSKAKKNKKMLQ